MTALHVRPARAARKRGRGVLLAALGVSVCGLTGMAPPAGAQPAPATRPAAAPPPQAPVIPTTGQSRYSRTAEREIRFQEGLLRYSRRQLAEAEKDFAAVVAEDPADAEAYYYLGLAQLDQNRPGEAARSFDRSIQIDPTADEVRAARATANIKLRRFEQAQEDINVLQPDPRWTSLTAYLRGQMLYAQGDLEGAAEAFAQAKEAGGPEAAPAEFYEGLTYLRMRELVRARATFREAGIGADRDPTVAAASRQLDAVLATQQRRARPWEVQLTAGIEYDSNAIQIGQDIPTPDGISDEEDYRLVLQPRGSYSLLRRGPLEVGVEGSGFFSFYEDLSSFDVASYQGGPFLNYRLVENLYASARYGFNYVEFEHDPFLNRHIITPQLTYVWPDRGYTSGFYQYQHREFSTEDSSPEFDRDGAVHTFGIVQGITLPELFEGAGPNNLELSYRFDDQQTQGDDFEANIHSLGLTLYAPLPVWKLRADFGVTYDFEDYENPNSLDTENGDFDEREDTDFSVTAGLTKEVREGVAVRVDYTYTDHESNVTAAGGAKPYEYDRHQVGLRLILSY